jgi:hypothetical protein
MNMIYNHLTVKKTAKQLVKKALPGINLICFSHGVRGLNQRGFISLAHQLSKKQKVIYSSFNDISNDVYDEFALRLGNKMTNLTIESNWEYYEENDPWELRVSSVTEESKFIMIDDFHTFMNAEHLSFLQRGELLKELHSDLKEEGISLIFLYECKPFTSVNSNLEIIPNVNEVNWCRQLKEIANTIFAGCSNAFYANILNEHQDEYKTGKYDYTFVELKCPDIF